MKSFPPDLLKKILDDLDRIAAQHNGPRIAAFDADGTLWPIDVGELFFKYQIESGELPGLPPDPWNHYHNMKIEKGNPAAYLWLAQINKGKTIDQVREWAKDAVKKAHPIPTFDFQHAIIEKLKSLNFKIYIVTASITWAVEPAAALYGLNYDSVLGVHTRIDKNYVTDIQEGVITYRQGKVDALLAASQNQYPLFVSGNTEGDLFLLEASKGIRLVVASARPHEKVLFETEQKMQRLAKERNWYHHYLLPTE
jgi:phosphoserine phosphatase